MNLTHVISEFSFGPYIPDISQPLDYSFEVTHERKSNLSQLTTITHEPCLSIDFTAFQYFVNVVPTSYKMPGQDPVYTNQYSVTHYTRNIEHGRGTPGIFFKVGQLVDAAAMKLTHYATVRCGRSCYRSFSKDDFLPRIPRPGHWSCGWCLGVRWMGSQGRGQGCYGCHWRRR
jgi:hypothetical protein